jgi:DNA-binding MarR family transcriptional regulator
MTGGVLRETMGYLLARMCRVHRSRAHALLDGIGLHRGQQFVLSELWESEGITHSELAERLQVRPATVTSVLKRMERTGLLERRRDTADERVSRVYLTDAGREIRESVERVWQGLEEETFMGFSAEELGSLRGYLERIGENLAN